MINLVHLLGTPKVDNIVSHKRAGEGALRKPLQILHGAASYFVAMVVLKFETFAR